MSNNEEQHIHYTARDLRFPLHEYDSQTLLFAMAKGGNEFTAAEMNKVLGRVRHTKSKGGDFRSYASLQRLIRAKFLSRSDAGSGCVSYRFDPIGLVEFLQGHESITEQIA